MPAAHAGGSPRPLGTEVRGAPRGLRLGTEVGGAPRGRWVQRSGGLPEASGWGQRSGGLPEASGWGQRSAGLPEAAGDRGQGGSPRPPAGDRGRRGSPRPLAGDRGRRGSPRPLGTEVGGAPRGRWGQRSGGLPEASGWGQRSFKSYRSTWPPGSRECWHQPSKSHETRNGIRGLIFTARVMSQRLLAPVVALEDLGTAPRDKLHWILWSEKTGQTGREGPTRGVADHSEQTPPTPGCPQGWDRRPEKTLRPPLTTETRHPGRNPWPPESSASKEDQDL
ncbi:fibril-forming collagen alpha chain-like isoform X2 [Suricata suricatta]|uniref:fibril-forming collagen alpha chain-like isoform X2 n=1 Tax=Suricata suricatta TaxID=37032 RepID=UPI0011555E20|nr:fibril-forming collagen alpha chain-like isoform X2 [Suricata suricatta]